MIVTRSTKGSPLTNAELDNNFEELDETKLEMSVVTITSTPTLVPASYDTQINILALSEDLYVDTPIGIPVSSHRMIIRIRDDGTPRAITWSSAYRALAPPLPSTTTANKLLYVGFSYNGVELLWDMLSAVQQT